MVGREPAEAHILKRQLRATTISTTNKFLRGLWEIVWTIFGRASPRSFHAWRSFLLRVFGAKIGRGVHVYPGVKIWAPWNLEIGCNSGVGDGTDLYSVAKISIGSNTTISQKSYLCTASHDYSHEDMPLISGEITIGDNAWITADVFVGPGITIGDGSVVLARSTVVHDLPPWIVARGNPATPFKKREIKDSE